MFHRFFKLFISVLFFSVVSCKHKPLQNEAMSLILQEQAKLESNPENIFAPEAVLKYCDSIIASSNSKEAAMEVYRKKANALLQLGEEQRAIDIFENLLRKTSELDFDRRTILLKDVAISYLRLGERNNCINNHSASSCIFPIMNGGIHTDKSFSQKAIEIYQALLREDPTDLESRWLLNIAYMTTGAYPLQVPPSLLLNVENEDSVNTTNPFEDVAGNIGLNNKDMGGGVIVDDFNKDGYFDIVLSSWSLKEKMHYFRNNGTGTFTDISDSSGIGYLTGGLNMMQTDYNNDGFKDIFVLRGAWKGKFGSNPNSLLRNNGNGSFTDVTKESGLLSFHPTQTATWADFNNDGWLDVFIGNESTPLGGIHPCELYINNKNGTFSEQAVSAGCAITDFVKGVTSGDYDNDGLTDIFISSLAGKKILLKNKSGQNGKVKFEDVSQQAGFSNKMVRTFPTWFWDYDNDGWLDILVCGYEFSDPLSYYAAAEAVHAPVGNSGKIFLFRNMHNGTFEELSQKVGLNKIAFAMGANFGDIDNDGYLDFYLGTGNPKLNSVIPNKLFKNIKGLRFMDVTYSARVGNLQKGHGISFADLDNDGDDDIYIEMGGAFPGDAYENSFYLNPGQNENHWINIELEGSLSNRAAIGAKIKVTFKEDAVVRSVYRDVNSGGSFGANPLLQHIGIGKATVIDKVEIKWPVTGSTQVFENLPLESTIKIKEGGKNYIVSKPGTIDFKSVRSGLIKCAVPK